MQSNAMQNPGLTRDIHEIWSILVQNTSETVDSGGVIQPLDTGDLTISSYVPQNKEQLCKHNFKTLYVPVL
jgi:hypothetical protein